MIIVPLPYSRTEYEILEEYSSIFDLAMDLSITDKFFIIDENMVAFLAEGTVPGKVSLQVGLKLTEMNTGGMAMRHLGTTGFLGTYKNIKDALDRHFPSGGYCVSNMKFTPYQGQKLKTNKDHFSVIHPILLLDQNNPDFELQKFFQALGWNDRLPHFSCRGSWENMELYIDGEEIDTLEEWFGTFCSITLR